MRGVLSVIDNVGASLSRGAGCKITMVVSQSLLYFMGVVHTFI